jgi:hypothetical protein
MQISALVKAGNQETELKKSTAYTKVTWKKKWSHVYMANVYL